MPQGSNGHPPSEAELLLTQVLDAAREMSRHDDPNHVMRLALSHGRRVIRFDRSLAATRRELAPPRIRITRSDAPGTAFHDPAGKQEFPLLEGGLLSDLLYGGQPALIDDLALGPDDP